MFYYFTDDNTKKMAWITTFLVILLLACLAWFFVLPAAKAEGEVDVAKNNTNYYALTTRVVELDRESDVVTVEDSVGNRWQFCGVEDWKVNDCASLLMWDNGTEAIFDDEVHGARYGVWMLTH